MQGPSSGSKRSASRRVGFPSPEGMVSELLCARKSMI
jgi:hypothetical protein